MVTTYLPPFFDVLLKEAIEPQAFWKSIKESINHQSYMVIIHTTF
jgi:hypothetical protein